MSGLYADAIPIYWGEPAVADMYNPARIINLNNLTFQVRPSAGPTAIADSFAVVSLHI
jgi:hypothetical protein